MELEILDKMVANIGKRKLVMRWKNQSIEKCLFEKYGIKASLYVTRNRDRVDGITTFFESILEGKNEEYYYLLPDTKYNEIDEVLYQKWGYKNIEDMMWLIPKTKNSP